MDNVQDLIEELHGIVKCTKHEDDALDFLTNNYDLLRDALESLTRPASDGVEKRLSAKLFEMFPEWEGDQRELIACELAKAANLPAQSDAVAAERERCARIADRVEYRPNPRLGKAISRRIAAAIRGSAT